MNKQALSQISKVIILLCGSCDVCQVVVDGYSAPLTAGNFVKLVILIN